MKKSVWVSAVLVCVVSSAPTQTALPKKTDSPSEPVRLPGHTEPQSYSDKILRAAASAPLTNKPAASAGRSELERQYLEGKITAKQYQKALDQWQQQEQKRAAGQAISQRISPVRSNAPAARPVPPSAKAPLNRPTASRDGATPAVAPPPVAASSVPAVESTPQQKNISEGEARIDEMLRLKAAREKAALSNATVATNNIPATPQTRRQRLDALLKQYLDGQLSEAEYNEKRGKILGE